MRILWLGDSLSLLRGVVAGTPGYPCTTGAPTSQPSPGNLVAAELARVGHAVTVAACGGYSYGNIQNGSFRLPAGPFDVVYVFLGTNDAANASIGGHISEDGMRKVLAAYKGAAIVAIGPPSFPSVVKVGSAHQSVDLNAAAVKVYAALSRNFSRLVDTRPLSADILTPAQGRAGDGIHFAPRGAAVLAERIGRQLSGASPVQAGRAGASPFGVVLGLLALGLGLFLALGKKRR